MATGIIKVGDVVGFSHGGSEYTGAVVTVWATGKMRVVWDKGGGHLPVYWPASFTTLLRVRGAEVREPARCGYQDHEVGDRVTVSYDGDTHTGTVTKKYPDRSFRVRWDSGREGPPPHQYRRYTAADLLHGRPK